MFLDKIPLWAIIVAFAIALLYWLKPSSSKLKEMEDEQHEEMFREEMKRWMKTQEDIPKSHIEYFLEDGSSFRSIGFNPQCRIHEGEIERGTSHEIALHFMKETWKADSVHVELLSKNIRSIRVDNIKEMHIKKENPNA